MSLEQSLEKSWVNKTERSAHEVSNLLDIASREIADASLEGISSDGRFAHAYAAVRALCEIALHACGYTLPKGERKHERAIESLNFTIGPEWSNSVDFFDRCRRLRHRATLDCSGVAQPKEADDLLEEAQRLLDAVKVWLAEEHPDLAQVEHF